MAVPDEKAHPLACGSRRRQNERMAPTSERLTSGAGAPSEARRRHVMRLVVWSMLLAWLLVVVIVVALVS